MWVRKYPKHTPPGRGATGTANAAADTAQQRATEAAAMSQGTAGDEHPSQHPAPPGEG